MPEAARSAFVDHLPHVDVAGAKASLAIVEVELPELLEAIVETQRNNLLPGSPEALPPLGERAGVVLRKDPFAQMRETMAGLEVDGARMRANIEATRGLMLAEAVSMALGAKLGRQAAHQRVEAACRRAVAEGRHLRDILAADPVLSAEFPAAALDRLFDPLNYLGAAGAFVERVLAARRS